MSQSAADSEQPASELKVLHLDHTSVSGGAEFALARMVLACPAWRPLLLVPPSGRAGVFASLAGSIPVRVGGVTQPTGVTRGGTRSLWNAAVRLAVQSVSTRLDPAFRTADIVDANTARAAAYGAVAAKTSSVPLVIHLRDLVESEALGRFGFTMMSRIALPRADGVIANSRVTLDSARPFLRPEAVTAIIPSASGLRRTAPTDVADVDAGVESLRIGMLARIDPWKGQMLLLEAFASAFPEGGARLEFAGGAPFGHDAFVAELRGRAAELGIGDSVVFLGHVDDVASLLAGWDVAVQASTRPEPLGQNVLQYLAAGRTTVVAGEGGPLEWVDDDVNGLCVPPRDPVALARVLRKLADDPALRSRLAAAAAATHGLLTDREVAAAHAEFYQDVHRRTRRKRQRQ